MLDDHFLKIVELSVPENEVFEAGTCFYKVAKDNVDETNENAEGEGNREDNHEFRLNVFSGEKGHQSLLVEINVDVLRVVVEKRALIPYHEDAGGVGMFKQWGAR